MCGQQRLNSKRAIGEMMQQGYISMARGLHSTGQPLQTRTEPALTLFTNGQFNAGKRAKLELTLESTTSFSRHHPRFLAPPTLPVAVLSVDHANIQSERYRLRVYIGKYLPYLPYLSYPSYLSACVGAGLDLFARQALVSALPPTAASGLAVSGRAIRFLAAGHRLQWITPPPAAPGLAMGGGAGPIWVTSARPFSADGRGLLSTPSPTAAPGLAVGGGAGPI
jgi:hypothetical protein